MSSSLNTPYGGNLIDLKVNQERINEIKSLSKEWESWDLTDKQLCDIELLGNGAFSPLTGFMGKAEYERVCDGMRLIDGTLWPLPVILDVTEELAKSLKDNDTLALRDPEGVMIAVLNVEDIWRPDRETEAALVYGTTNIDHPGVNYLLNKTNSFYIGGKVEIVEPPSHYDFQDLRDTPAKLREKFDEMGWQNIVAFQTRNPMHKAHQEITYRAAKEVNANLLIHPVVGLTKPGDVDHYTRVRCYQSIVKQYPEDSAYMSLLPLAMRLGGPREGLLHAIIRKNYGCTHIIIGRDHAGPGNDSGGTPFYGPYEAQELFKEHEKELGIQMVPFKMVVYLPDKDEYAPMDEISKETKTLSISGTELRNYLSSGQEIPEWFSFPDVVKELHNRYPQRAKRGLTVFFTGLSGSGKSTIANILMVKLLEKGGRPVTLLDGDIVRKNLSSELGFSKEHRNLNILRIGYVASEITKNRGIAICAPIAPYDVVRKENKKLISRLGEYILIYLSTPVETCEQRDRKGLYAKARAGIIKEFTGISDPYEVPKDANITIDTTDVSAEDSAQEVMDYLEKEGYIS